MGIREFDYVSSFWYIVRWHYGNNQIYCLCVEPKLTEIGFICFLFCSYWPLQIGLCIVDRLNFVQHNSLISWNGIDCLKSNSISICLYLIFIPHLLISYYLQNNQSKDKWRNLVHIQFSLGLRTAISTNKVVKHTIYRTGCETEIL